MKNKIILTFAIVIILAIVSLSSFYLGKLFQQKQAAICLPPAIPSSATSTPMPKQLFKISEEDKKLLSSKENFQAGLAEIYKEIPLYTDIQEKEVWTFLKPLPGILYTLARPKAEVLSFYEEKLKERGWTEKNKEESGKLIRLEFSREDGKILILAINEQPPTFLPKELGLKEQTYVSFYFSP